MLADTRRNHIHIVFLQQSNLFVRAEDLVKTCEGALCPNDKATEVTTRCELEKIKPGDLNKLDTGQVPESLNNAIVLVVNNEGATTLTMPPISHLANTSAKLSRVRHLE